MLFRPDITEKRALYLDIGYIKPIDGLRAIAVLSVMAYHAYSKVVPSGLIGVDIFFVISGFVVSSSILSRDFAKPGELLIFFFSRRILRIVPALLVCLLVTTALTITFLPQGHLSETNLDTARAALFGFSNFILFNSSDSYFATRAELNPFTHTWSLAVEEQFYLLFPLLTSALAFVCARRWSWRGAVLTWATLTIASAIISASQSIHAPVAAFYLLPARFWELGIGVLAYIMLRPIQQFLAALSRTAINLLTIGSLTIIALSLVFARSGFPYPFPSVAPAALATIVLICILIASPSGRAGALLSRSLLVHIGRISYSLYLWHWPVFVLMRWTIGFTTVAQILSGIAIAFALAEASYRWVESPIRRSAWGQRRRIATIATSLATLGLAAGGVTWASVHQLQLTASVTADRFVWAPEGGSTQGISRACDVSIDNRTHGDEVVLHFDAVNCRGNVTPRQLFVVGDSHAGAMIRVFVDAGLSDGVSTRLFSLPGCGALTLLYPDRDLGQACEDYINKTFESIAREGRPGDVLYLPSLRMRRLIASNGELLEDKLTAVDPERAAAARGDAELKLKMFEGMGMHVVISAPLPVFRIVPYRCADWFNRNNPACRAGPAMARDEIERRRETVMSSLARLRARFPFVFVWDPTAVLCDEAKCSAFKDGKPLFYDGDHLSGWGDDVLQSAFVGMIKDPR